MFRCIAYWVTQNQFAITYLVLHSSSIVLEVLARSSQRMPLKYPKKQSKYKRCENEKSPLLPNDGGELTQLATTLTRAGQLALEAGVAVVQLIVVMGFFHHKLKMLFNDKGFEQLEVRVLFVIQVGCAP